MEKLSPANQALLARIQNEQIQEVATNTKTIDIPADSVELSTKIKKPKNKIGAIIAGIVAGVAVITSLAVAYKKGVFFKLEGALLKKEADKAYKKAQVVVDEVTELIKKGKAEGFDEFVDEKTGRRVRLIDGLIEEFDGDTLTRWSLFDSVDEKIKISSIHTIKKDSKDVIELSEDGKIKEIVTGLMYDENEDWLKFTRRFDYENRMYLKNVNYDTGVGKGFDYNSNGKLEAYYKQTKTHGTEWTKENGTKRERIQNKQATEDAVEIDLEEEIEIEDEILVEDDFIEIPNEELALNPNDIIITGSEETAS